MSCLLINKHGVSVPKTFGLKNFRTAIARAKSCLPPHNLPQSSNLLYFPARSAWGDHEHNNSLHSSEWCPQTFPTKMSSRKERLPTDFRCLEYQDGSAQQYLVYGKDMYIHLPTDCYETVRSFNGILFPLPKSLRCDRGDPSRGVILVAGLP